MKKPSKIENEGYKCKYITIPTEYPDFPKGNVFVGVDPGIHYGITVINEKETHVVWGTLPKKKSFTGMESIDVIQHICCDPKFNPLHWAGGAISACVEGPAFKSQFGQTQLEQVRFGFVVGLNYLTKDIRYVAPSHARKVAFGDGKKAGKDIWLTIDENGADSIGIALTSLLEFIK